ncbi:hypothetical protein HK405_002927 [Cladochytrium tenue]|nr:hypothetical protein HK405_002927 [Cladochytrium tenue]
MSLRFVPSSAPDAASAASATAVAVGTGSAYAVHDALRAGGPRAVRADVIQGHPLESHLQKWDATQDSFKLASVRQTQGAHMPIRILMERELVGQRMRIPALKRTPFAEDILSGRDMNIEFEDFLGDMDSTVHRVDVHGAMEVKMGMSRNGMPL